MQDQTNPTYDLTRIRILIEMCEESINSLDRKMHQLKRAFEHLEDVVSKQDEIRG